MTKPVAETSEWKKCPDCGRENSVATWEKLGKCPNCGGFPDRDNIEPAVPAPEPSSKDDATIENPGPDGYARIVRLCDVSEFTSGTLLYAASKLAATAERELPPLVVTRADRDAGVEYRWRGDGHINLPDDAGHVVYQKMSDQLMCRERQLTQALSYLTRAQEQIGLIAAQANRLNEEKNATEQQIAGLKGDAEMWKQETFARDREIVLLRKQIAALQGRIEEADGLLRDQLAWCPCDEIHSDPPCDRCKRVAKWLTAPIAPEKEG